MINNMRKKRNTNPQIKIGMLFDNLTVIKFYSKIYQNKVEAHWLCQCKCGKQKIIRASKLHSKDTRSCGGVRCKIQTPKSRKLLSGEAAKNKVISNYRIHARTRCFEFLLTHDEILLLFKNNCFYCGSEPSSVSTIKMRKLKFDVPEYGDFIYNGIDRIDNSKGYTTDNVVSCCGECNRMKSNQTILEFMNRIKRIYELQKLREIT